MKDLHTLSNCWRTPKELFDKLNKEYTFTHDLCADKYNHLCEHWFEDYLTAEFEEGVGYCNPSYSNPKPFVEKCWQDSLYCKIIMLVKCDPSTKWWATFWEYGTGKYNGPKPGCEVLFFPKRIKFDPPQQLIDSGEMYKVNNKWVQKCKTCEGGQCMDCKGKGYTELSGPTFSSALLIFDRRGL